MVMDRFGTDLQKKFEAADKRFPRKVVLQLGLRLVSRAFFSRSHVTPTNGGGRRLTRASFKSNSRSITNSESAIHPLLHTWAHRPSLLARVGKIDRRDKLCRPSLLEIDMILANYPLVSFMKCKAMCPHVTLEYKNVLFIYLFNLISGAKFDWFNKVCFSSSFRTCS